MNEIGLLTMSLPPIMVGPHILIALLKLSRLGAASGDVRTT